MWNRTLTGGLATELHDQCGFGGRKALLQYSCLGNPTGDLGSVCGIAKNQTRLATKQK